MTFVRPLPMSSPRSRALIFYLSPTVLLLTTEASAHGGHTDKIPEGEAVSPDPLDSRLWTHILLMILSFGMIFPFGMVLGIVRSRWHVPVQIVGTVIATVAYFLGHMHRGRQFRHPNIHASFANSLVLMLIVQVGLGVGLKLHLERKSGWVGRVFGGKVGTSGRRGVVMVHGWLGKMMPIVSWAQMLFGGIVAMGYCRGDHLGQCLAHFIMGSAFIAYGIIMTLLLLVGQAWLRGTGRSQEFFDSIVIAAWGCVNTFTEHRWGHPWVKNDLQHTSMGIVWWCAGLLGIWLSRSRNGRPKRNLLPGIVIFLTGWAMGAHPQSLELSTMVHTVFGYTLMAAGAARIVEISFLLKDSRGAGEVNSWQHLPPFLLYASGFMFMGATEEQMQLLSNAQVTHVSYILILFSIAFLLYLFVNILLYIYASHAWPDDESNGTRSLSHRGSNRLGGGAAAVESGQHHGLGHSRKASTLASIAGGGLNGSAVVPGATTNGHVRMPSLPRHQRGTDSQQVRDAEEFELEGLISEGEEDRLAGDDDDDTTTSPTRLMAKKENGVVDTPV
ncbi:Protein YTP1 [Exophiala dermatitidis]